MKVKKKVEKPNQISSTALKSQYDLIVVGGGAAGVAAAIMALRKNMSVLIIEHTSRILSKVLATGNGRCNFTNYKLDKTAYYCDDLDFVDGVISDFDANAIVEFFKSLGIYPKDRDSYVYPSSDSAKSVVLSMMMELDRLSCHIAANTKLHDIKKTGDEYLVLTNEGKFRTRNIVLATGLKAMESTGSDGSFLDICQKMGLGIKKVLPALVGLGSEDPTIQYFEKIRVYAKVSLIIDGKFLASDTGELQFNDDGLSGIPVFQLSHRAVEAIYQGKPVILDVDFMPDYDREEVLGIIRGFVGKFKSKSCLMALIGLFNEKVAMGILKKAKVNPDSSLEELSDQAILDIVKTIKSDRFVLSTYKGYEGAQVCQGGIRIDELKPNLELKKYKNIYAIGELCDVDGICGGYNLSWAFASAHKAVESMA